ncbi:unnamed protein product [Diatraea saccharalis]|uniref:Uncharacterized protein n=1 Tax=Diatraea saccharalis TaxID=40085 RepID=A0A9N9R3A7_9NEOP|nr:unnamed protein product [Diatraea saccharalis]
MSENSETLETSSSWKKQKDWKNRYAKLYGNKYRPVAIQEDDADESWRRISFMTNENTPYTALLMRVRANRRDTSSSISPSPKFLTSILSQQSDLYGSYTGTGSMLSQNQSQKSFDTYNRLSSSYRSRVSDDLGGHDTLLLDMVRARSRELQEEALDQPLDLKNDDNLSDDVPRPVVATIDREAGVKHSGLRSSSATWQLTRARRFRIPKPSLPPPEASAPPAVTAPLAQRDLDLRVSRFLMDMGMSN